MKISRLTNEQCGICANCVPQIDGGSGFANCADAHAAEIAGDEMTNEKLTNERITWRIDYVRSADISLYAGQDIAQALAELQEYRKADERGKIRAAHAEWSRATLGNVGPVGPLKHLSKEALEAAAEPGNLSEWADMQFLLWDAQSRAGITDEEVTAAMVAKLEVNRARKWPEPKDGEPRLHIKGAESENT